jgi:hypothetical protein
MVGGHDACAAGVGQRFAADLRDRRRGATHSAQGRSAERDDDPGRERPDFGSEPDTAGLDMAELRSLMQPPFTPRLPTEMLHRIGDEYLRPRDLRLSEQLIQQSTRRPNERVSLVVLSIAGLLAHQHNMGFARALTQHRLSGALPQLTAPAGLRSFPLGGRRWLFWAAGRHVPFIHFPRLCGCRSDDGCVLVLRPAGRSCTRCSYIRAERLRVVLQPSNEAPG